MLELPDGKRCRRRCGANSPPAFCCAPIVRQIQDQEGQGRRQGRCRSRSGHHPLRRPGGREEGVRRRRGGGRRRHSGARPGQRAGQRARPGRIRGPRQGARGARRRGRGADRKGDEEARHGRAARRRAGLARGRRAWWSCSGTAARPKDKPVAFVGKGVVFDTGGISIKPAAGMEDMKGDMGGAAAVTGLMHALAARKAKVNAHRHHRLRREHASTATRSGRATSSPRCRARPSRCSTPTPKAASCWPTRCGTANDRFKPQFMVDLATLTGAIMVALGQQHAGLFSNNDELAERLPAAGQATAASSSGACRSAPTTTS